MVGGSAASQMRPLRSSKVSPTGAFKVVGAFQAAARPLIASAAGRRPPGVISEAAFLGGGGATCSLAELSEGPYFIIAMLLDGAALCRSDASCRLLRALNRANAGPWRALGTRAFHGMELDREGVFEAVDQDSLLSGGRKHARVDWKGRFAHFQAEVPTFRAPFVGSEISLVTNPDEVAYCRCRLRSDLLSAAQCESGVYMEVEVVCNPDNLSLAVVDFEAGGRSSVTFSPDTGAVIRERKVRESPRKVEGAYIQPLSTTRPGRRFEGSIGLYIRSGHLAFFRRCSARADGPEGEDQAKAELGPWETTGFITDLDWAEGRRLTPCLAFRDEGAYKVRLACVGSVPPHLPQRTAMAYQDGSWSGLDWEAGQAAPEAA
eukprot:CAMPEP_0115056996 /NCGR_PEP_ID=MMETSP0227-20121206/5509_1 /TAXON_ID=89957 /ORGANISM="Polarella glacialis, Strain CCMP 1383" /LENGTH=375 /DNA_ID=CAMNT_0002441743 /DNA_START=60 /DNA_END=1187 /DNA_ORIENTATION=+